MFAALAAFSAATARAMSAATRVQLQIGAKSRTTRPSGAQT